MPVCASPQAFVIVCWTPDVAARLAQTEHRGKATIDIAEQIAQQSMSGFDRAPVGSA